MELRNDWLRFGLETDLIRISKGQMRMNAFSVNLETFQKLGVDSADTNSYELCECNMGTLRMNRTDTDGLSEASA